MPAKMARSAPRSAFGPPERPVSVGTSRLSCEKAVKPQYSPPVRASSEESPLMGADHSRATTIRAAQGDGSRPRRQPGLPERGKSAKIAEL